MNRPITETERMLISRMVRKLPARQRDQLMSDLANASSARELNHDGSIIELNILGYQRSPDPGRRVLPVDGRVADEDGELIELILFSDENGRLYEFEIVRYAEGSVIGPDWSTLELY